MDLLCTCAVPAVHYNQSMTHSHTWEVLPSDDVPCHQRTLRRNPFTEPGRARSPPLLMVLDSLYLGLSSIMLYTEPHVQCHWLKYGGLACGDFY